MRRILSCVLLLLCSCSSAQSQSTNDWTTQFIDYGSGCHAHLVLTWINSDGEEESLTKSMQGIENYQIFEGHWAEANVEKDPKNWSRIEVFSSITMHDVDPEWHRVAVGVGREHATETDLALASASGVTYWDSMGVATYRAEKDGLTWGRMRFQTPTQVDLHEGPEPQIVDGMAIRGSLHGTHIEYVFDASLWRWTRTGEVVWYDASEGANVVDELPVEHYPGFRGLNYQQFNWPFKVTQTDLVEAYGDVNGSTWEPFYSVLSEQQGSFTRTADRFHLSVELKKKIEDLQ